MPEKVTIPIAFLEYSAEFERPLLPALMDRARIVQAIFDALTPWGMEIDNVEPITTGKPSHQGVNFKLPEKKVVFFFGAASCKFTKDDANWAAAEEMSKILTAARRALFDTSGAEMSVQKTFIALHLQPRSKTFVEILKPFLSPALQSLENANVKTGASIIKWEKRRIVLDGSAALANAVFLKFEREFDAHADLESIAFQLKNDEDAIFKMLDVEEDL